VEKVLKGIIEEFEIGFVKIHNLERLLGMVTKQMIPVLDTQAIWGYCPQVSPQFRMQRNYSILQMRFIVS